MVKGHPSVCGLHGYSRVSLFSGSIVLFCCWIIYKEASDSCDELMALNKNFENTSRYYKAVTSGPI